MTENSVLRQELFFFCRIFYLEGFIILKICEYLEIESNLPKTPFFAIFNLSAEKYYSAPKLKIAKNGL